MKLKIFVEETFTTTVTREHIEIDTDNYPELILHWVKSVPINPQSMKTLMKVIQLFILNLYE
jgi:hypothetical protein